MLLLAEAALCRQTYGDGGANSNTLPLTTVFQVM